MSVLDEPFVSVIVPVFNDAERLDFCLACLSQQSYREDCFEIIVVDNNSDNPALTQTVVERYHKAKLVHESCPGSYAARNRGIEAANGEILAFTDADCLPDTDWLLEGVKVLQSESNCGQVSGLISLFSKDPQNPTPVELYEYATAFRQEHFLQEFRGGVTANLLTWKGVLEAVGTFDSTLKSSGDIEWGQRVYRHGYKQIYASSVIVRHPTRSSWSELYKQTRRLAGGHYELKLKTAYTFWQRQMVFIQAMLYNLMPPVFFTINMLADQRLQSTGQKLKVSGVMIVVRGISALETLRLKLGKTASRI